MAGAGGTGAAGARTGGAAGTGAAGAGALAAGLNGLGATTFVAATCPGAGASTSWTGAMMFWIGAGSEPTVVRMPSERAISRATAAPKLATANAVPTSRPGRGRGSL
jgi:hypothetical protein